MKMSCGGNARREFYEDGVLPFLHTHYLLNPIGPRTYKVKMLCIQMIILYCVQFLCLLCTKSFMRMDRRVVIIRWIHSSLVKSFGKSISDPKL